MNNYKLNNNKKFQKIKKPIMKKTKSLLKVIYLDTSSSIINKSFKDMILKE